MITTKVIKIEKTNELTSEYIETELKKTGLDILRWVITDTDEDNYILSLAVVDTE